MTAIALLISIAIQSDVWNEFERLREQVDQGYRPELDDIPF